MHFFLFVLFSSIWFCFEWWITALNCTVTFLKLIEKKKARYSDIEWEKRECFSFPVVHVSDLSSWIIWNSNCGRAWGCFGGRYAVLTLTASHSYMEAAVDRWSVEDWEIAQTHSLSHTHIYTDTHPSLYTSAHHPTHCNPFIIAPWCRDQSWGQGFGIRICVS